MYKPWLLLSVLAVMVVTATGGVVGMPGHGDRHGLPCEYPMGTAPEFPTGPCGPSDAFGGPSTSIWGFDRNGDLIPDDCNTGTVYATTPAVPCVPDGQPDYIPLVHSITPLGPKNPLHKDPLLPIPTGVGNFPGVVREQACQTLGSPTMPEFPSPPHPGPPVPNPPHALGPDPIDDSPWYSENANDFYGAVYYWQTGDDDPWLEDVWSPDQAKYPEFRFHVDPNEIANNYVGSNPLSIEHEDPNLVEGPPEFHWTQQRDYGFIRLAWDGYYRGYFDLYDFPGDVDAFYATVHPDNLDGIDNDGDGFIDVQYDIFGKPVRFDRPWAQISERDKPEPILDLPIMDGKSFRDDRGYDIGVVMRQDQTGIFCAYGAYDPDGPYYLIGSAFPEEGEPYRDATGQTIGQLFSYRFDLSRFYTPATMRNDFLAGTPMACLRHRPRPRLHPLHGRRPGPRRPLRHRTHAVPARRAQPYALPDAARGLRPQPLARRGGAERVPRIPPDPPRCHHVHPRHRAVRPPDVVL
jgi:hypothetical protein